jgi:hypothetical protein
MNNLTISLKTFSRVAWLVLALAPVSAAFAAPIAHLSRVNGYVTVTSARMPAKAAANGMGIENGSVVATGGDGRAVIKFRDGQVVALQSRSVFRISDYQFDQAAPEKGQSFLALLQGGARVITGLIGNRNREGWKLAMPTVTIGIRGTEFLGVVDETTSYIKVKAGSISTTNGGGTAVVAAGQNAAADSAANLTKLIADADLPPGLFNELEAMGASGGANGSSSGAGGAAGSATVNIPAAAVGIGIGAAAIAATVGGDDDDTTTTHH